MGLWRSEDSSLISDRIKTIRKMHNLSQREFGERLGVSRDVISNIEYNRVEPKDLLISHICKVYGVNEKWLRTGKGNMQELVSPDRLVAALEVVRNIDPDFYSLAKNIASMKELQPNIYAIIQQALYQVNKDQKSKDSIPYLPDHIDEK